jgi:hypothetical protein
LARDAPTVSRLEVLLDSRLGSGVKLSPNAEAGRPFTILLSCSTDYLMKRQAAYIAKGNKRSAKLDKCIAHFGAVEQMLANARQQSDGRLKLKFLKSSPLELQL